VRPVGSLPDMSPSDTEPERPVGDAFLVRGGARLVGTVELSGAKNSVLKLMAASLLTEDEVLLSCVPAIADVPVMAEVLSGLGVEVTLDVEAGTCRLRARQVGATAPRDAVVRIRASIATLGPLVARQGRARVALPGGDRIGVRSIDLHLSGLRAMGAEVALDGDEVDVVAHRLHGARITLDFPSVGATENLVMAATLADGVTVLDNAAREPEIADLCSMLVAMGARIDGIGSPTLVVTGVERLGGVRWETCPDRIEAGTYLIAAALTGGDVTVRRVRAADLTVPLRKLRDVGAIVEELDDAVRVVGRPLSPVDVVTLPYPGFPTDLQPQMMVLMTQAQGVSRCTENVFESRFSFVEELRRMGADIDIEGHHATIAGPTALSGATLAGLDVRAGAAGVLAGLVASGETLVRDAHHVDRGYADLVPRLVALGAEVERVDAARPDGAPGARGRAAGGRASGVRPATP
jgi:UDP-N-acetylglucosamine 1-carboxyvinyltransferase